MFLLETPRLQVRPLAQRDFPNFYTLLSHADTMRYISTPMTEQQLHERWAKWTGYATLRPGLGTFVLEHRGTDEFAGLCVARQVEYKPDHQEYEIGYIFAPPLWGQGLASELVPPLCAYCFSQAPAQTAYLVAFTDPDNGASQRVLLKSGFRYVGTRTTSYGESATFILDRPAHSLAALQVRPAIPADAAHIAHALSAAFEEHRYYYTPEAFAATILSPDIILQRWAEGPVWVAEQDGQVVGTVAALPQSGSLYVRSMGVLPQAQGQGAGYRLLQAVQAYAYVQGYTRMHLATAACLHSAIRLYERCGYERGEAVEGGLFGTPIFRMEKRWGVDELP